MLSSEHESKLSLIFLWNYRNSLLRSDFIKCTSTFYIVLGFYSYFGKSEYILHIYIIHICNIFQKCDVQEIFEKVRSATLSEYIHKSITYVTNFIYIINFIFWSAMKLNPTFTLIMSQNQIRHSTVCGSTEVRGWQLHSRTLYRVSKVYANFSL